MVQNLTLKRLLRELIFREYSIIKPRGAMIEVDLNPLTAKYNHKDVIKISRKSRLPSKKPRVEKSLNEYSIVGKCIAFIKEV